eukprot:1231450-Rhodomonas_salina.1
MAEEGAVLNPKEVEARRQQMIFELNSTGRYYDFKEKLKRSVQRIVREKFHKEGLDAASEEGKMFMSTLYVHLQVPACARARALSLSLSLSLSVCLCLSVWCLVSPSVSLSAGLTASRCPLHSPLGLSPRHSPFRSHSPALTLSASVPAHQETINATLNNTFKPKPTKAPKADAPGQVAANPGP